LRPPWPRAREHGRAVRRLGGGGGRGRRLARTRARGRRPPARHLQSGVGRRRCRRQVDDLARAWFAELFPAEQALAVTLAPRGPFAAVLVEAGFASHEREVRLAAARAAERHVLPGALGGVQRAWSEN